MKGYFAKRLLIFIPTLITISIICFFLLQKSTGDPVQIILMNRGISIDNENSMNNYEREYAILAKTMHRDLPFFYFSITPSIKNKQTEVVGYDAIAENKNKFFYPVLRWHGIENQYNYWLQGLLSGHYGVSLIDGQKIETKINKAFLWTLSLVTLSFIIVILIAIPLGATQAFYRNSIFDKISTFSLYLIYGMPVFWIATMMIVYFTTPEYGEWTNIFPSVGLFHVDYSQSYWQILGDNMKLLVLPVFCISLHGVTFLSRMMRSSMVEEMHKPYVLAAQSRGIAPNKAYIVNAFPNSLIPIVTILFASFAALLSGTVIIEVIFNIPGMGRLMMESIYGSDWPVIMYVVLLLSMITMIFYFITDLVYTYINPKIKYT